MSRILNDQKNEIGSALSPSSMVRAALALTFLAFQGAGLAFAELPQPDADGNYGRTTHARWEVVDSSGVVDCRIDADWLEGWYRNPMQLDETSFSRFEPIHHFDSGARLNGQLNLLGSSVWFDSDEVAWLGVQLQSDDGDNEQEFSFCFVRANVTLVRPVE